jgi:hypothetical protein
LNIRRDVGVTWLWYRDRSGIARQVKLAFTDFAMPDDFLRVSAGRCAFHIDGLKELVEQVTRLKRRLDE